MSAALNSAVVATAIPLDQLILSSTPMQVERRKQRTKEEIADLAETITRVGQLQPIIARPNPFPENIKHPEGRDLFEIVAGEGRYLAAQVAGLTEIKAEIHDLTDQQAEEVQMIENLQRKDLNELLEAVGFDQLKQRGLTAEEIAHKVGKSERLVYTRLQLLKLSDDAQDALRRGDLPTSHALLIARIPGEELQQRALKYFLEKDYQGRTISYREAQRWVHETFMLSLSNAPFAINDETLLPSAGACGPCPMRTGNSPDLFDDVKGANVCTNPKCYQAKKAAHVKRELEKAKATGATVIRGGEAKRILPPTSGYVSYGFSSDGSHKQLRNGYARPKDKCLDDPKKRTYAELAGKDAPKVLLQHPDTGRVEEIFKIEDIADRLKAKGVKPSPPAKDRQEAREQDEARRKQEEAAEMAARRSIFQAIIAAAPTKLSREDLATLMSLALGYGVGEDVYELLGMTPPKNVTYVNRVDKFRERLLEESDARLAQLAVALTVVDDVLSIYSGTKDLVALAKRFGIDPKKVRKEHLQQLKRKEPEPAAAPKATKKKTTKAKAKGKAK